MTDGYESPISTYVVEDHEITRMGLRFTLEEAPDIRLVGEAADGRTAVRQILELKPRVVLMDIGLPGLDGIAATKAIKSQLEATIVLMLTSHDSDQDLFASLAAGADGYCLKDSSTAQLLTAIRAAATGVAWFDPGVATRLRTALACLTSPGKSGRECQAGHSLLSPREIEVLSLVMEGRSNHEVAEKLCLSMETIKSHMRNLMEKLGANDRTQAAVQALRLGLV